MKSLDFGKYKGIIVSVALFLLLDASVLMLNFYISFEIADDAIGVNTAGRQRMLSQRMMKSLLDMQAYEDDPAALNRNAIELRNTVTLFNQTLNAFRDGGTTVGANARAILLPQVTSSAGIEAIKNAESLWRPFHEKLNRLNAAISEPGTDFSPLLSEAVLYGRTHNLQLLALMNSLTMDLERTAASKANRLRLIQATGISLAIVNFFIIMFHFVRQLRESDEQIEAARQETQEILQTVNEGLFLLDENLEIGQQHSQALEDIFDRDDLPGKPFNELLKDIVCEKDLATARDFVELLFTPSIKENLIGDLNPLNEVEIYISGKDGTYSSKYLSFEFSRVASDNTVSHVLVTVSDITRQVALGKALDQAKSQNAQQIEMLSAIVHTNSDLLNQFLANSKKTFNAINDTLRQPSKHQVQLLNKLDRIFALIHNFKGEASALDLSVFVDLSHQLENQITELQRKSNLEGNDFLGLTISLEQLMAKAESTETIVNKLSGLGSPSPVATDQEIEASATAWQHLQDLADKIASKQSKSVEVVTCGLREHHLSDEFQQLINNVSIQLVRNAVVHGIETESERSEAGKPASGVISIRLQQRHNGTFEYQFHDDGQGLDLDAIRHKALAAGVINEQQAQLLDRKQLIALIFHPGLSTHEDVTEDAGRGIGMHSIKQMVKDASGKITIGFTPGNGCTFSLSFPATANPQRQAA